MKKILALILALCLLFTFTACGGSDTDNSTPDSQQENVDKQEPKVNLNPVRSELFDLDGTKLADVAHEYDDNGNRLSNTTTWIESWGGEVEKDSYDYDADGKLIAKHKNYNGSDYVHTTHYEYNPDGTINKTYSDDYSYNQYEYGADGRLSAIKYISDGEVRNATYYTYDDAKNAQIETEDWGDGFVFTYTTYYNDDGTIAKWEYENNGKIMRQHLYEYNDKGQLIKQGVSVESWKFEGYVVHHFE